MQRVPDERYATAPEFAAALIAAAEGGITGAARRWPLY